MCRSCSLRRDETDRGARLLAGLDLAGALASLRDSGEEAGQEIIFLIDEIEAHLHPQWQRRIVKALLDVMEALTGTLPFRSR